MTLSDNLQIAYGCPYTHSTLPPGAPTFSTFQVSVISMTITPDDNAHLQHMGIVFLNNVAMLVTATITYGTIPC